MREAGTKTSPRQLSFPAWRERSTGVHRHNKNAPVATADFTAGEAPDPGGFAVASQVDGPLQTLSLGMMKQSPFFRWGFPWGLWSSIKSRPLQGDRTGRHPLHNVAIDVPSVPVLRTCQLEPALGEVEAIPGSEEVPATPGSEESYLRESAVQTMMELVEEVDQRLNPGDGEGTWMLFLDFCPSLPVHGSTAFGTVMCDTFPHVCRCYVYAGTTGVCQPLDRQVTRPFKVTLRNETSRHFARTVLSSAGGSLAAEFKKACTQLHTDHMDRYSHCRAWEAGEDARRRRSRACG